MTTMNDQNHNILTYTKVGDYYIPDLALDDQPDKEVGVYGRMRERYLQEHHPGRYSYMLLCASQSDGRGGFRVCRAPVYRRH